ncbi:hypothetical protein J6590_006148 [Homalodisca vitripennis]|nr:hypothetical protein J6590_006148 [Homalodisca vitripennis]
MRRLSGLRDTAFALAHAQLVRTIASRFDVCHNATEKFYRLKETRDVIALSGHVLGSPSTSGETNQSPHPFSGYRTVVYERLPSQAGVQFLNRLPNSIKHAPTPKALKTRLKRFLVSQAFYNAGEFLAFDWDTAQLEDCLCCDKWAALAKNERGVIVKLSPGSHKEYEYAWGEGAFECPELFLQCFADKQLIFSRKDAVGRMWSSIEGDSFSNIKSPAYCKGCRDKIADIELITR